MKIKLITITLASILLSGCFYQQVDIRQIKKANSICEEHEGVYKIRSWWLGTSYVDCKDTSTHSISYKK